jgi:FHS family L-fucose permease-like MFS transporter
MIIMAIIGGAVFPPVMGLVYQMTKSMAIGMLVNLVAYAFIAYYGFVGSRVRIPAARSV